MQILLVAATEPEIAPFLKGRPATDFLITGVGSPVAIYQLSKRLHQIDYDLVIQAGIAGSFTSHLKPGEVVLVKQDHFADLGISEKNDFHTIFEAGLADENLFPFTGGWLRNETAIIEHIQLQQVKGLTVNSVSDNKELISRQVIKFDAQIESMEGAALHYVCLQEHIPFIQVRSISNYVGERNKANWKMQEAIDNLNIELLRIVDKLAV